jgi:hypothetical protein
VRALRQRLHHSISILGSGPILLASHLRRITRNIEIRLVNSLRTPCLLKARSIGYPARTKSDIAYCPAFISSKRCAMCATDRGAMTRSWCVHLRNHHSHWRKRNPLSKCPLRCHERVSSACKPFG